MSRTPRPTCRSQSRRLRAASPCHCPPSSIRRPTPGPFPCNGCVPPRPRSAWKRTAKATSPSVRSPRARIVCRCLPDAVRVSKTARNPSKAIAHPGDPAAAACDLRDVCDSAGQPLPSRVSLGSGTGDRATAVTDMQGRFEGWMRRPKTNFLLAEGRMGSSLGLPRTGDQRRRSDGGQAELDPRHPLLANCGRGRRCRVGTSRQCRRRSARPAGGSYLHTETNPDGRFELSGLGFGAIFCLGRPEGRIHLRPHRSTGVNRRTAGANRPRPRPRSQRANPLAPSAEPCPRLSPPGYDRRGRKGQSHPDQKRMAASPPPCPRRLGLPICRCRRLPTCSGRVCVAIPETGPLEVMLPPLPSTEIRLRTVYPEQTTDVPPNLQSRLVVFSQAGRSPGLQPAHGLATARFWHGPPGRGTQRGSCVLRAPDSGRSPRCLRRGAIRSYLGSPRQGIMHDGTACRRPMDDGPPGWKRDAHH